MAIIQLPSQPTAGHSLGQALGGGLAGLGTGIGSGISNLVNMKLQNLQKEQKRKNLESSLAPLVGPEKASLYSAMGAENPQVLGSLIKMEMEAPGQRFYESILGGGAPQQSMVGPAEPVGAQLQPTMPLEAPTPTPIPTTVAKPIAETKVARSPEVIKAAKQLGRPVKAKKTKSQVTIEAERVGSDLDRMRSAIASGKLGPKQVDKISRLITQKEKTLSNLIISKKKEKVAKERFDRKQNLNEEKFELDKQKFMEGLSTQKRKEERIKQEKIDNKFKAEIGAIKKKGEAAMIDKGRFAEMKRINEEGDLGSTSFNIMVDALQHGPFGMKMDLTALQTDDAQAMQKLSRDFIKNVKETLGTSRITQAEVMLYLKTIPNLMQSREGRQRVIETNELLANMQEKKLDITNDIIKKNNGKVPENFDIKLIDKFRPYIKKFEKEIKTVAAKVKKNPSLAKRVKPGLLEDVGRGVQQLIGGPKPAKKGEPQTLLGLEKLGEIPGYLKKRFFG